MSIGTLSRQLTSGRLGLLARVGRLLLPFYRMAFLAGASRSDLLPVLAKGPVSLEDVARSLGVSPDDAKAREALSAWLGCGVGLRVLSEGPAGYALRSRWVRRLAHPEHDPVRALVEELGDLHHRLLLDTPRRLASGTLFTLADQDGALIARSSRIVEPFIAEAVRHHVPPRGELRLLEVGCGTGIHVRHAAACNPRLTAVAVELQPEVAAQARQNLAGWELADRVTVEAGDIRARPPRGDFDLVTLHQNIYYFPVEERPALLAHLREHLAPGGTLLVTSICAGGSVAAQALNLWASATRGAGRLPSRAELEALLGAAGLEQVTSRRLLPGEAMFAVSGRRPGAPAGRHDPPPLVSGPASPP